MFVRSLLLWSLFLPALGFAQRRAGEETAAENREVRIRVGAQETVSAEGVRSYSEGIRGIVDVRLTPDETRFVLAGLRAGTTSLLMIMRDGSEVRYTVIVEDPDANVAVANADAVPERPNVRLDLYFVQISDEYSHAIGVNFPGAIGSASDRAVLNLNWASGAGTNTALQILSQTALPRLDIAQAKGWARVYRHAALVTSNGSESEVNIGGEMNIMVAGAMQNTVHALPYGTRLRARPQYDASSGRVQIRLDAEVSDLTPDSGSGVPGRDRAQLNTTVTLELGQSIVLGGVVARSESRSRAGLPGLSQIPILGALFGTHSTQSADRETLLFIVPSVEDPLLLSQRNRIHEALTLFEDFTGGVLDNPVVEEPRVRGLGSGQESTEEDD